MRMLAPASAKTTLPEWLDLLLRENFFAPCSFHHFAKKNEKNVFCVDCCYSLCPSCLHSHSSHRLLQIRRYVYHDVLRLDDAEKLLDCSSIQPYISNGAKVVFLNQRPTSRPHSASGNICASCDRVLQHPFLFCSVSCKVDQILNNEGIEALFGYLRRCDFLPFPDVAFGGGHMTPDSVLEASFNSVLSSSNSSGQNAVVSNTAAVASTATTESVAAVVARKKRTPKVTVRVNSNGPGGLITGSNNRRKRAPQRSPML
uniref:B box-type domain-containing protein n=1 Tax=Kalanchoe fedtschenkoi TaxID=63787 RepID=A0A7N0TD86_KALFE